MKTEYAGNGGCPQRDRNTRKGYWAVAGSGILTHTITNKRLVQAGYFDIAQKNKSLHCL